MQLPFAFNPGAVAPAQALEVLPLGWYPAKGITESEVKGTSKGGTLLAITVELQNGRKVWHNFNIVNENQAAVEMAYADMAALCGALGIQQQVTDTQQLHNRPFDIKLRVEQSEGYDPKNVISKGGFAPLGSKQDKYIERATGAFAPQAPAMPQQSFHPQQPVQPQQFAGQAHTQGFQPSPPVQQNMPQFQPQAPQAPFAQPNVPAQAFAHANPAQPQQGFQQHPGAAPAWTQPR